MKNYVCWEEAMVHRVMNTEAIQRPDHLFLAIHQPLMMYREGRTQDFGKIDYGKEGVKYSEQEFLDEFLGTPDFAFVPILGEPGTGKSHLVRWLAANIEAGEKRHVLLIPKVGTNLRDIIREILRGIEGPRFDEYRKRLDQSAGAQTESEARELLLSHLAMLAGPSNPRNQTSLGEDEEWREALVNDLPSFLHDPYIRKILLKDGGVIHRLTIHTIGHRETVEHVDERRQFNIQDLPVDVVNIGKASQLAQKFYRQLAGNDELQEAVVRWLNRHLDTAMVQVLNLGRDELKQLMREVREELGSRGAELILLIEDFTIAQGIDKQLLDSILAPPDEISERPLCVMRTAVACTPGYFKLMADTVRQRTTFRVVLDFDEVGAESSVTQEDLEHFVSKYLNAARWDEESVRTWAASLTREAVRSDKTELKSRCFECRYQPECHEGFGAVGGIGFYPFTSKALERMSSRINDGKFNPRLVIKDLLKYTLINCRDDLRAGKFPPPSLVEQFQGGALPGTVKDKIREKDPQNYARRQVLLDLWSDGREVVDLHERIHEAFDLPPLGVKTVVEAPRPTPQPVGKPEKKEEEQSKARPETPEQPPAEVMQDVHALDRWTEPSGARMPQELADKLRKLLFEALRERIQWDAELMLESDFIGNPTGQFVFLTGGINFRNAFQANAPGIKIVIPFEETDVDKSHTQLALQGLILHNHYKNWAFPEGERYFRRYASKLEEWSAQLLEKIRAWPRNSGSAWDPVPAATKLLAVGSRLAGIPTSDDPVASLLNSVLAVPPSGAAGGRAEAWRSLFEEWTQHRNKLRDLVLSRVSCVKGDSRDVQVVDVSQLLGPLEEAMGSLRLNEDLPEDLRAPFHYIRKLSARFNKDLQKAVNEEKEAKASWYRKATDALGENFEKDEVVKALKTAVTAAVNEAKFPNTVRREDLSRSIDAFGVAPVEAFFEQLALITDAVEPAEVFTLLSGMDSETFRTVDEFLKQSEAFLSAATLKVEKEVENFEGARGSEKDGHVRAISADISKLCDLIKEVKEG